MQTNIPNCSRIGLILQSVTDQSTVHPKPGQCWHNLLQSCRLWRDCRFKAILTQSNQSCHNPESPRYHIKMQCDCRTTKDCDVIERIASTLHELQENCGNSPSRRGINSNPNQFSTDYNPPKRNRGKISPKSIHSNADRNRQNQIELR